MIRLVAFAALIPLVIVLLWEDAPSWVVLAGWGVGAGLLILAWQRHRLVLNCPHCGKGMKLGATTCHHCGRDAQPA